jgi:glucosamine--fructose-6-phosphate aminotransferase (isomerizing)
MSTLAREEKCGVFLNCGRELSVASTKAFLSQVVVLTMVSLWFAQKKTFNATKKMRMSLLQELKFLSTNVKKVYEDCLEWSKQVSEVCKQYKHMYLLSTGLGEVAAKEGTLKIKELTYMHCQCFSINSVSNQYFNYVKQNEGTPTIFVVLDDEYKEKCINIMKHIKEKTNITAIIISDVKDKPSRDFFE